MVEKDRVKNIMEKAETIMDLILKHLEEDGGCNHNINSIVKELFGPGFEGQDQYQNCSSYLKEQEVTT